MRASYLRVDESKRVVEDPVASVIGDFSSTLGVSEVTLQLVIGAIGLFLLGVAFHKSSRDYSRLFAVSGWPLIGLFFYLYSGHYVEISDPVLIFMTASALPAGFAASIWEWKNDGSSVDTIIWMRGFVVWSMIPYYLVFGVPYLNMAFVQLTAVSANILLDFVGLGGYEIGPMMIERYEKEAIPVSEWRGSRILLSEPLGEGGFFAPMTNSDGEGVVSFILACSALQSMAVFIGAIVALSSVSWKRRARALMIAIPTIHVLNVFRNAGIVWLTDTYPNWRLAGIGMFDFAHSYAAKIASLFAMFLMAIALFDLLPELHRHIMKTMRPILVATGQVKKDSDNS
ncbi:MAG: archaeosortase A [Euryarchaeota archaeon]|nr:archaeosortase A [Euryarchaeota archaeon]OUW22656.1 MAG: archaeosortase A [Euryarchaeota archaeon TMED173]